ncbi:MAG: hypothetical protein JWN48_163 [Myxococcaceae bacterium]|nr:hypothetical protein [Myxococcaceae bacterium]
MSTRWNRSPDLRSRTEGRAATEQLPDVRDGLTRVERVILYELHQAEREHPGRRVPTAVLYGRVVEHINLGIPEFQRVLERLVGRR